MGNAPKLGAYQATDPGKLLKKIKYCIDNNDSFDSVKSTIFIELGKSDVKAEFALDLIYLFDPDEVSIPNYINEGLKWLQQILCVEE